MTRPSTESRAYTEVCGRAGAKAVALFDIKQELGDQAAAKLRETTGIPVQFHKVDVRDSIAVADAVSKVTQDLGTVEICINSAGVVE